MPKRRTLIDAPRPTIYVTEEIIEKATQRHSSHCMIAEAIKQQVPDAKSISVDLQSIRWTDRAKGLRYIYMTPRIGQMGIIKFDQGHEDIEPFKFSLRGAQVIAVPSTAARNAGKEPKVPTKAEFQERPGRTDVGVIPLIVGGKAPPRGPLSNSKRLAVGQRREFGLRSILK